MLATQNREVVSRASSHHKMKQKELALRKVPMAKWGRHFRGLAMVNVLEIVLERD